MANTADESVTLAAYPWHIQRVQFSFDTDNDTIVSQALEIDTPPDMYWATRTLDGSGAQAATPQIAFDDANNELDFQVQYEASPGTIADTWEVFLVWFRASDLHEGVDVNAP